MLLSATDGLKPKPAANSTAARKKKTGTGDGAQGQLQGSHDATDDTCVPRNKENSTGKGVQGQRQGRRRVSFVTPDYITACIQMKRRLLESAFTPTFATPGAPTHGPVSLATPGATTHGAAPFATPGAPTLGEALAPT